MMNEIAFSSILSKKTTKIKMLMPHADHLKDGIDFLQPKRLYVLKHLSYKYSHTNMFIQNEVKT